MYYKQTYLKHYFQCNFQFTNSVYKTLYNLIGYSKKKIKKIMTRDFENVLNMRIALYKIPRLC